MKRLWILKFTATLFFTTVITTMVWEHFVEDHIYSCSDGVMCYPIPADLLALTHDEWPLKFVPEIVRPTSMSDPDLIKEGWTVGELWILWAVFLNLSLAISTTLASRPWPFSKES